MRVGTAVCVGGMLALAAVTNVLLSAARDARPTTVDAVLDAPPISADVLRVMALGFTSLAADVEYLTAIQVFGDRHYATGKLQDKQRYSLAVYRLIDYTTDFDPDFDYAYIFAANAIPVATADGNMLNAEEATRLLRKAMRRRSHDCEGGFAIQAAVERVNCDWRIPFFLGYSLAVYQGKVDEAATVLSEAVWRPKCPAFIGTLATRFAAVGGVLEVGKQLALQMEKTAITDDKKQEAHERYLLLQMEQDIRKMESAERRYVDKNGHLPVSLQELVDGGFMLTIPPEVHESGGHYELDPATGEIRSTVAQRLKLPDSTMEDIRRAQEHAQTALKVNPK